MYSYIYLLQAREFINTKQNIYKLGKSRQENLGRFKQYPKGSKLIIQLECENCDINEKALIKIFKESFKQRTDIGTEYFEGNPDEMRKIICHYINNEIKNDVIHNENTNEMEKTQIDDDNFDEFNQKIKETFNKKQPYIIKKYEDYKKISTSTIQSIIITDKNKQKGYILFDDSQHWHNIEEYNVDQFREHLLGWLKHYSTDNFEKDNIMYYTKEKFDEEYNNCMKNGLLLNDDTLSFNYAPFYYDYDNIIKDICKTCFNKEQKEYILKNYEYFISINNNYKKDYVLNTKTWEITEYNPNIDKILTGYNRTIDVFYININAFQDIDTIFVNDAILILLNGNNELYKKYKQICYNIFVEHQENVIIMDYTYDSFGVSYILDCITNLLDCLVPVKSHIYISNGARHGEKMPNKYNNNIRLVIIRYDNVYNINRQVAKLQQLGYKNIIIMKKHTINIPIEYNNFIIENELKIKQLSEVHTTDNDCFLDNKCFLEDIPYEVFNSKKLLLNNFLKWCCEC